VGRRGVRSREFAFVLSRSLNSRGTAGGWGLGLGFHEMKCGCGCLVVFLYQDGEVRDAAERGGLGQVERRYVDNGRTGAEGKKKKVGRGEGEEEKSKRGDGSVKVDNNG
jgi:hypothetical protein